MDVLTRLPWSKPLSRCTGSVVCELVQRHLLVTCAAPGMWGLVAYKPFKSGETLFEMRGELMSNFELCSALAGGRRHIYEFVRVSNKPHPDPSDLSSTLNAKETWFDLVACSGLMLFVNSARAPGEANVELVATTLGKSKKKGSPMTYACIAKQDIGRGCELLDAYFL